MVGNSGEGYNRPMLTAGWAIGLRQKSYPVATVFTN